MISPAYHAGERSHVGVEVQQERGDNTVISSHCLCSGRTALSMSNNEAKPLISAPSVRTVASSAAALPTTMLQQVRCLAGLYCICQLAKLGWILKPFAGACTFSGEW
jgi:hypothetical protein